jgi:hypothetical protein
MAAATSGILKPALICCRNHSGSGFDAAWRARVVSMNSRQKTIIRILQLIFYPLAAVMVAVFVWNFIRNPEASTVEFIDAGTRTPPFDPVMLVVVLLFWIVFLALLFEFLAWEIFRLRPRNEMGRIILEIGAARSALRFVPFLAAIPFVVGFNAIVFGLAPLDVDMQSVSLAEHLVFWLFYGIAHFLLVAFLLRAVRNRAFFVLTSKGFLYEPGDVSPGLILWEDVAELREAELLSRSTSFSGPSMTTALTVALKDPAKYNQRYTPLLALLNWLLTKFVRYQTGEPGDIVLLANDFGDRYDEVKALMLERVQAAPR